MNERVVLSEPTRIILSQLENGKQIGLNIKSIRKRRKISQRGLADKLCCRWVTVSKLERAQKRMSVDWLFRLCDALGVEPVEILNTPLRATRMQRICRVLADWRHADREGANAFLNRLEAEGLMIVEAELTH